MKFDAWKEEPYESLQEAFPDIAADFEHYYHREKAMAALFPTFSAMFRKLGNWLCPDQAPLEAFVVGDFLYWEA